MNLSEHVHVTRALHVEMSVADRPECTRVIGVPRDAPSYWVIEAYRLSLGLEPEWSEFEWAESDDGADSSPLIDLTPWRSGAQQVAIPGVADVVDVVISGPFTAMMGDPRVTVVDAGPQAPSEQRAAREGSAGWQVRRPPFHAGHVEFELAQRFGLVQPHFDSSVGVQLGQGLKSSSPIATLSETLTPVRRLALLAHLEEAGLVAAPPPEASAIESATASLRMLVARIGSDGLEQDQVDGWLPRAAVSEVVDALGWQDAAADGMPDPVDALMALARRSKAVRRLRGRVVVTHRGQSLAAGEARAFPQIVEVLRDAGRAGPYLSGQSRKATLALLAVADGSVVTVDEVAGAVAAGESVLASGRDDVRRFSEWTLRSHREGERGRGAGETHAVQRVVEGLCALSSPGAFGAVTTAMRAVASAALR
ncbi:MAG: hypothetical protein ACRDT7_04300 [Microbacterium sp.]